MKQESKSHGTGNKAKPASKTKISLDEEISKITLKSIEQDCLDRVFYQLCELGIV